MLAPKIFLILTLCQVGSIITVNVKFTNIKCIELDSPFASFPKCFLKLVRRGTVGLNLYVKIHKLPVTNATVNIGLYKKLSGYRPFLYNQTFDFCKAMGTPQPLSFMSIVHGLMLESTNINHPCPYNHDLILNNTILQADMFKYLPLPEGEYMLKVRAAAYNSWKADVQVFFQYL